MSQKIVVALGGNAILSKDASAEAQKDALRRTAEQLLKFIQNGDALTISHGNGPQVGNLLLQQQAADSEKNPAMPLDTCVAMTEGSIGFWLQNAMLDLLRQNNIDKDVVSLITQVEVSAEDPAFANPTKPIGPFVTEEEAKQAMAENADTTYKEDAGRGWRKVVASPKPIDICEKNVINSLVNQGVITISVGGGGIPVVKKDNKFVGVEAVIDKDFASEKLAELIDADTLLILTAVDNVYINYNKPDQKKLEEVSVEEAEEYIAQGQFAAGSMLPKVEAALAFVKGHKDRRAVITSLDNIEEFIKNGSGTVIVDR